MAKVFVGIGANLGDRAAYVEHARVALAGLDRTDLVGFSGVYETDAVSPVPQDPYLNAAARIQTELDLVELLDALTDIELSHGREPLEQRVKWGPRTMDLDILLYDDRVVSSDELVIPHPMMHERWFVLKPLNDLDPNAVHPLLQMTVGDLLKYAEDSQKKKES